MIHHFDRSDADVADDELVCPCADCDADDRRDRDLDRKRDAA